MGRLTRRGLVAGAIGLALVGCAAEPPETAPSPADPSPMPEKPDPVPAEAAPAEPEVDVEAVIAAHEGRAPTHWGTDIPGVARTAADFAGGDHGAVYLTLDACGGPAGSGVDRALIDGLLEAGVPATLFLNLRWLEANRSIAESLAAAPQFSIQNHGAAHVPLSVAGSSAYGIPGTTSARGAALEVWESHLAITELTGIAPCWFRPGTAHLDDVGLSIAEALGERIAGFAINGDGGATLTAPSVSGELDRAAGGEIVLAHMNQPGSGTAAGILDMVEPLRSRGLGFAVLPAPPG